MKSFLATTLLAAVVLVSARNPDLDEQWEDFVQRYDKNYELDGEEEVLTDITVA